MYKVKATGPNGPVSFACGTDEQAFDRVLQLLRFGLEDVGVVDPAGKVSTAEQFRRKYFEAE